MILRQSFIKRSPLGRRKNKHLRQENSKIKLIHDKILNDGNWKRWPLKSDGCLTEVTSSDVHC